MSSSSLSPLLRGATLGSSSFPIQAVTAAGPSRLSSSLLHPRSLSTSSHRSSTFDASRPAPWRRPRAAVPSEVHDSSRTTREGGSVGASEGQGAKEGKAKSVFGSYKALAPNTRIALGMGLATFAVLGILTADRLEATMPASSSERRADGSKPKLLSVSVVERRKDSAEEAEARRV